MQFSIYEVKLVLKNVEISDLFISILFNMKSAKIILGDFCMFGVAIRYFHLGITALKRVNTILRNFEPKTLTVIC